MNIIDAIKSGKPFRRPHWYSSIPENEFWIKPDESNIISLEGPNGSPIYAEDILANDWEVKKPVYGVTKEDFLAAVDATLPDIPQNSYNQATRDTMKRIWTNLVGISSYEP